MKEIKAEELIQKVESYSRKGTKWHFHLFSKDCLFNKYKDKFVILLENEISKEQFYSFFEFIPKKEAEEMAGLMYGSDFLEEEPKEKKIRNEEMKKIIKKAEEFNEEGIEWHHHHFPPKCLYNKERGKHCIVLEDKEKKKLISAVFDEFPEGELRKIEKLFYSK